MIDDWRAAFGQGAFPFLVVQLANHRPRFPSIGGRNEDDWAELREAQALTAARHPRTYLAVTIDIGDRDDIHPTNKREVARRLVLAAMNGTYGQGVEHAGPTYAGHQALPGGRVRVRYRHAGGLTVAGGDAQDRVQGFELAGTDRQWVAADARIEGDTVILHAPGLPRPVAIRYAWGDDPAGTLTAAAGLPAAPFRTDAWPRLTARAR
jgi:sialate O-acetylesterase